MGQPVHRDRHPSYRFCSLLRRAVWTVTLLGLWGAADAEAQPNPACPPDAGQDAGHDAGDAKSQGLEPALMHVAAQAAKPIAPRAVGAVVVGAALQSDAPAPRGAALVSRIVGLVAGALGSEARAARVAMPLDAARAEAASSPALVYLQTEIANGELRVTVDVYPIPRNIWDRSRNGSPGPIAHGFASARIDAEVRTFLAPIALVARARVKVPLPSPEVVALACDDIDRDGAVELVVVSRRTLAMGRVRQGRFVPMRQVDWQTLSPIAPVPWRQPMGTVSSSSNGILDVGLTDRAQSIRLNHELTKLASYDGMPVPTPTGASCATRRVGSLTAELGPCLAGDEHPDRPAPFHFDAAAALQLVGAQGEVRSVWAQRNPTDGSLLLQDGEGKKASVQHVGAQIALSDVDLDGDPDLVASKNVLNASNDGVVIRSWRKNGAMVKRLDLPVPDGVTAVAVCPVDGPGQRPIAVATTKELWIIQ